MANEQVAPDDGRIPNLYPHQRRELGVCRRIDFGLGQSGSVLYISYLRSIISTHFVCRLPAPAYRGCIESPSVGGSSV